VCICSAIDQNITHDNSGRKTAPRVYHLLMFLIFGQPDTNSTQQATKVLKQKKRKVLLEIILENYVGLQHPIVLSTRRFVRCWRKIRFFCVITAQVWSAGHWNSSSPRHSLLGHYAPTPASNNSCQLMPNYLVRCLACSHCHSHYCLNCKP